MQSICLFLPSGKTFTFRDVIIRTNNETTLEFAYKAMSDKETKYGFFQKSQMVGFSVLPPKEDASVDVRPTEGGIS